jgi:multiple sugar transport system substrate-binding protein
MITLLLTGCQNLDPSDEIGDDFNEDTVFVPEFFEISGAFREITHTVITDEKVLFSTMVEYDEDSNTYKNRLFYANFDGTDVKELTAYNPSISGAEKTDAYGVVDIQSMLIDIHGNIWLVENGYLYDYDLPIGFNGDDWDKQWYLIKIDSYVMLRKLDNSGAEIFLIDLNAISGSDLLVESFKVDHEGNTYVFMDYSRVYVFDNTGAVLFHLTDNNLTKLINLHDGSVAGVWLSLGSSHFKKIDLSGRGFDDDAVPLPSGTRRVFEGNIGFDFLIDDRTELYGYVIETNETVLLFDWMDLQLSSHDTKNVDLLSDGRIFCVERILNRTTFEAETTFVILTSVPFEQLPEKTTLTLATFNLNRDLERAITNFNRKNNLYHIHLEDYARFATNDNQYAGLTQLTIEITAGRVPDILDITGLPFDEYISRGLLVDLYELLDTDPELNRDSFISSVLHASEVDSGLYYVFPSFSINTVIGSRAILGDKMGWDMDEFLKVIAENPDATSPFGEFINRTSFIQSVISLSLSEYIDFTKGEVYFDRGDFKKLLEFIITLPEQHDFVDDSNGTHNIIATGRQIMSIDEDFSAFSRLKIYQLTYNDDVVFKGYPVNSRNGNIINIESALSITTNSKSVGGAWAFIRTFMTEDWQLKNVSSEFPVNKNALETKLFNSMGTHHRVQFENIILDSLTQADTDQIMNLFDSLKAIDNTDMGLFIIVMEGVNNYLNGTTDIDDTIRIIQSRAKTYVSERS